MGFVDQVDNELQKIVANKSKRKKKDQESGFVQQVDQEIAKMGYAPDDDIAPVFTPGPVRTVDSSSISDRMTTKNKSVTDAILGTARDANFWDVTWKSMEQGFLNSRYGEESFKEIFGEANEKQKYKEMLASDEYNFAPSNKFEEGVSGAFQMLGQQVRQWTNPRSLGFAGAAAAGAAVLGQAGPQILAPEEVVTVPGAFIAGMGAGSTASALEIEAGHAYNEMLDAGVSEKTAKKIALAVGSVNAGLEMLQIDELVDAFKITKATGVTKNFTQRIADELIDRGIDVAKETAQEVAQEGVTIAGTQVGSKIDKGEWAYGADEVAGRLGDTAMSSALTFGMMNVPAAVSNTVSYASEQAGKNKLTDNEQKVVDKVYEEKLAEAEQKGEVSKEEKKKIYDRVVESMEKGYISTDTIEEILGGESYSAYRNLMEESEEFNTLYKTEGGKLSEEQRDRLAELKEKNKANPYQTQIQTAKEKLSQDVFGIAKSDRLVESYNERARRGQAFEADLSKYDKKQQQTIQNAINSGLLNNTNRTHELVDFIAKISADKGVLFDFTNNEKIKGTQFAVEGKIVNGYVTESGVTLNVESPKYLNTTVGHEITHVLEGTEFYDTLRETIFNYAIAKDGQDAFNARLKEIESLYKGMKDTTAEAELTADLVGEYLFTDSDFIQRLSTENRNVFQKIYDEIKYLCRVATAGSKEARELERVKKAFEDAYRAEGKQTNTQHSLSDNTGRQLTKGQQEYFKDSKMRDDNGNLMVMYHGSQDAGFHVFDSSFSDDDTSFFFVDRNDVAASYSGTSETYEAKTIRTAEDMNNFLAEIGYDQYEAIEQDGKYELLEDGDHVAYSDTAQGLYEEFCWYEGVGNGDANYKVYLNLKNPLVVDADGRNWDNVSREFSQEVADKYHSLTAEEKEALTNIAEWGEISIFRDEIRSATDGALASAYEKLGKDINMYDLFSIAEDNFSEESIEAWAVKQMNTRDYAQKAKAEGYDGVIFENIHDNGGYSNGSEGASTVAIAFDSNQIKSTANENPTADKDIRYSISEEQNQRGLNTEQEVMYSLSKDTEFSDNAIKKNEANKKSNHYSIDSEVLAEAKQLREAVAARMREIKEMGHVGMPEDTEGKTDIANSSYDVTEENTTICPRSLASEAFVDAVSEYLGRPLTVEEQIYISQDLLKPGRTLTPECTYCYVATDRKAYRAFLGEYINQRDAVLQKLKENPDADVSRSGELYKEFLKGRKDTNPMYKRFKMWADAYKNGRPMVEASHLANMEKLMGDIKSEFGAELKPQIVDAMKYAQSASWAKKRVSYVAYNGHILKWKQDRINKLNSHYGLRMYSFSDFHPAFVLENMQMITDASVRGLKMLGYTKDTDFVEIFAPSGMNINISTFGGVRNGTVFEDSMMGANWQKAKALRMQYPNVGITFVATNDTMVEWALAQDWIDVVIPYHLVRTGEAVAKAFNYTNYTSESSDKKTKEWTKGKDDKYIAPTKHNNDKATYLKALADNNLEPRFARFIDNPNYMKLVNECRQSASESKPVQPKFNEDAINEVLAKLATNGYYQPIGGSVDRMYEIAAEVAESMTHQLAPAMSLSNIGDQPKTYGTYNVSGKDVALEVAPVAEAEAPVVETAAETPVAPVVQAEPEEDLFPDDLAPSAEEEANEQQSENIATIGDENAPPEMDAPYYGEEDLPTAPSDPFEDKDIKEVGNRNVNAYMYENPEVKPFFQAEANVMLGELRNTTKGGRIYNDELYSTSGGEKGWDGVKRDTSDDIAYLRDTLGYSYAEIEKGLKAIIEDNGKENIAVAKRIEFILNDRLFKGYTEFQTGMEIPPDQEYINLVSEKRISEYSEEAFANLMENADQYAPMEDIAPVPAAPVSAETIVEAPIAEEYEAIGPKREKQPKLIRVDTPESSGKERKWVGTSTGSEAVDRKVLPEDLDQELTHYQPISNRKTLGNANAKLDSMGYENAVSYMTGQFASQKVSLDDIALGERLIQEAVKKGDYKTAGDLIMEISILGTELGQKVQALSIIKRLTPEGQLKMLQRVVDRGKTKGDMAFEGVEITQDMIDYILQTYGKDGSYDQDELNMRVEDVKQQIADQMKVGVMDYINEWRYLSMLGNPKTHIRNMVSNAAMWATRQAKNAVARTIEDIAPIQNRTKTWEKASEDVKSFAKQMADEVYAGENDNKYSDAGSIKSKRKIFKTDIANRISKFNSDALSGEDTFFSKPAYRQALQEYLTANGIRTQADIEKNGKIVAKAKQYAMEQAKEATFQQDSYIASKISEIERKNPIMNVAVGSVLPFKKTPINIAKTAAAYSPLGLARNLYDAVQVSNGKMEASEAVDHLAQTLTGTALTLVGYAWASAGFLNGAGDDDKEGKYDYQLGEQSYSFNFNGDTFSLSWLSPVAMPLFVGANAYEQFVEDKGWDMNMVSEALAKTLDPLSEMSFLSSLADVLSSYDSGMATFGSMLESASQSYITSFIPTLSSQIAQLTDDTKRSSKVSANSGWDFGEETWNQIKYKIPGLRQTLEPSTDIWGNEVKQTDNVLAKAFESFLAPYARREDIATEVDEEIKALYKETGDDRVIPAVPYNNFNYDGVKYEMSAKEFTEFKKIYGQNAFDLMEQLFKTETYRNADSESRAEWVDKVYDYAWDEARKDYFDKHDLEYTNATKDGVEYYRENPIKGAIENDVTPDEYSFSAAYPEKYAFFKANGISYEDYNTASEEGKKAYTWAYNNPEAYTVSKAISGDLVQYRRYASDLYDIRADKDKNGNSINGTAKAKKIEYINNTDLDYGGRIILFKTLYPNNDEYNYEIVNYLNSRDDLTYDELESILKELGFEVDSEGNISW